MTYEPPPAKDEAEFNERVRQNMLAASPPATPPPPKLSDVMYYMTKSAARVSFSDFLSFCDVSFEEWQEMVAWFKLHGIETYL